MRDLRAARGASAEELDAHTREADRVRLELAELIGGPGAPAEVGAAA